MTRRGASSERPLLFRVIHTRARHDRRGSGYVADMLPSAKQRSVRGAGHVTAHDWHGQDVQRDADLAEEALRRAGGDESEAAEIFEAEQEPHRAVANNVPENERDGGVPGVSAE